MVGGLILTDEKLDKIYGHKREFASISESMLYDIKKKYSPHKLLSKLRNVGIIQNELIKTIWLFKCKNAFLWQSYRKTSRMKLQRVNDYAYRRLTNGVDIDNVIMLIQGSLWPSNLGWHHPIL